MTGATETIGATGGGATAITAMVAAAADVIGARMTMMTAMVDAAAGTIGPPGTFLATAGVRGKAAPVR